MNGYRFSKFMIWWLVPGLFVATAFQCGSKKKSNGCKSANLASRSCERGNETSVVIDNLSRTAEGNGDSDTLGHSESEINDELGGSSTFNTVQVDDRKRDLALKAIDIVVGELCKFFESKRNGESPAKLLLDGEELWHSLFSCWDDYYRPCSWIWIYLEQLNLTSEQAVQKMDRCTCRICQDNNYKNAKTILSSLLKFLLNRGWPPVSCAQGRYAYDDSFQYFIERYFLVDNRDRGIRDININNIRCLYRFLLAGCDAITITDTGLRAKYQISDLIFMHYFSKWVASSREKNFSYYWIWLSTVSRVALALTKIEWNLIELFGCDFKNYKKDSNLPNDSNVLDKLISFYKGDIRANSGYSELTNIIRNEFSQLPYQVEAALERPQNLQL